MLVVVFFLLLTACSHLSHAEEFKAVQPSPLITNILQVMTRTDAFPERVLLPVHLEGTVVLGGIASAVVVFDGASIPEPLPIPGTVVALERGQRFLLEGRCLLAQTNLVLGPRPLIENDGLHPSYEQSAGVWWTAGKHALRLRYFDQSGEKALVVSIAGPAMPRQTIAASMLFHRETNAVSPADEWRAGVRFKGYAGNWVALPDFNTLLPFKTGVCSNFDLSVAGRSNYFGLEFEGFIEVPRDGLYTLSSRSDDGSEVQVDAGELSLMVVGRTNFPALRRVAAGQLIGPEARLFCGELEGTVSFAARDGAGLKLELVNGRGSALVQVLATTDTNMQWLVGARVRVAGICQSVFNSGGYQVAGQLVTPTLGQIKLLEVPEQLWQAQPQTTARNILDQWHSNSLPTIVHLAGLVRKATGDGRWVVEDNTGSYFMEMADATKLEAGLHVEVFGQCSAGTNDLFVVSGVIRRRGADNENAAEPLPWLTSVEQVKQMSREEAQRGYPVKVRGLITFVWPDAGFFLQDDNWSIDVRMSPSAAATIPTIGDYWEVEGETFAEFAPNIRATHARRMGLGSLPEVVHPNWGQLIDGSLDSQYIELQGIVSATATNSLYLLTWGGRIKVQLPEIAQGALQSSEGALVRVRGCVIPGRDIVSQQVKLGEFELRNASIAVDEPAPNDAFASPLKHASDLLLFDSHASPIQRVKLQGIVLQQRDGVCFFMDESNGVRLVSKAATELLPGERIEVVGFPNLNGPSPLLRDAVVRKLGKGILPAALLLPRDLLLERRFDATFVAIDATLVSLRNSGPNQILEMRSGARIWVARMALSAGRLPTLALGSELRLKGVYVGQGGDSAGGWVTDSFELLLNSPADIVVLKQPSWWTARHALLVAGGLLAVLLLAFGWISVLHKQVEQRTAELKQEIEDHKRTELKLEDQTKMLTREIEERVRMEAKVEYGHKQLLITSRLAGMAEVATSVLHNVGNVMTSVNVLSAAIVEYVRNSKISSVARLAELLGKNRDDLPRFFAEDDRARKMPDYVDRLATHLADEQSVLLEKVRVLNENIQHINEIVAMQQDNAQVSGVLERLAPAEVVEDAIRMHGQSLQRHGIELVRDFHPAPTLTLDRHKVLQILFNLLENAKHACLHGNPPAKRVVVGLGATAAGRVNISVADNGMGIPPENLKRIFGQGFSTRKDGHGFGLHSSILAAQDMGGTLSAHSDGVGLGARFVLEIPVVSQPTSERKNPRV